MILSAHNLSKSYNNRKVLKDVSINLRQGEAVGLMGPNGAGKTTCFSIIAGLVKPDSGSLFIDNSEITFLPIFRRAEFGIGYLPQESSIFRGLNVADNIMSILEISIDDRNKRNERLEELLGEFSISHLKYTPSTALSGGERRRLEIARALAANPKFILLDEPLAGIDPISVGDIKRLIIDLKSRDIGILVTDHNVREALHIVDRAYIMFDGQVLFEGSPHEIASSARVKEVYLGEDFKFI